MSRLNVCFILGLLSCQAMTCLSQELPIKPTRTISFTTDEGTDMNVDVSPDGRTLVFDLLGDLYTVAVTGGNATQLTRGMAINLRPVWSPDSKRIAYFSDFSGSLHVNVRDLSGKFHLVLGKSDEPLNYFNYICPLWTPDGNYVALARGAIYGLTGGEFAYRHNHQTPIQFSEHGRLLYYLDEDSGKLFRHDQVSNTDSMISPVLKRCPNPALSPNARWWVYATDSNNKKCLIVQDLINNTQRILVPSLFIKCPFNKASIPLHYSFSSDSKFLFIGYGGKIHRIDVERGTDVIIPFIAHIKSDAGPLDYNTFRVLQDSVQVRYTRSANASPDGKHLVFSALNRLYVMDLPDGKAHLLVPQSISQFQPVYSPDGKWIAYVSWCDTIGGYLWRVPASSGQPEQLTYASGNYQRPAWSPDGTLIAVVKSEPKLREQDSPPETGQLQLISVNGGSIKVLDDSISVWNQIAFSADGKRVIYAPRELWNQKINPLLISKDLDGKNMNILAVGRISQYQRRISQRQVSPDGRFIVYSLEEDLYLVPTNGLTGPPNIYDETQKLSAIRFAPGVDPFWEKGGKILSWSYGNHFYRIDPEKIITAARKREAMGFNDSTVATVRVKPDQVVTMHVAIPGLYAHGTIALEGVRIITMQGDKVIEHGTIVIKDGRFIAVGPSTVVSVPAGAKVFDLQGKTVMPGFVDVHLHVRLPSDITPQQSWTFLVNLAYGMTTARDPSTNFDSFGYGERLKSGQMIGPRLYSVGRAILPNSEDVVENIYDARAIVHKRAIFGGTTIKQYLLPTRLQKQWLLIASREAGLNMTNEGEYFPIFSLAMMKDGSTGVEHNPDWGDVYKDVTSFIKGTGTYFTPTLQVRYGEDLTRVYSNYFYWHLPYPKLMRFTPDPDLKVILMAKPADTTHAGFLYPAIVDAFIRHLGGRLGVGSHGNNEGVGIHNEIWALHMGGLSNMEALQAATVVGAEALGIQKDVGSIEVGKIADLIVLDKNPLDDIHNSREIRYVMKDGILYDGNNLDIFWPFEKKCPEWRLK